MHFSWVFQTFREKQVGKSQGPRDTGARDRAGLPLQGELSLLLLVLHDLGDALLLRVLWVRCFGLVLVSVHILFFRGKVTIA